MNQTHDLLWKKSETNGKANWEKVGVIVEKDNGKKAVKLDLIPAGDWDGWLVISERKAKK